MNILNDILNEAIRLNASDIHLTNNIKPVLRIDGNLDILEQFEVNNEETLDSYINHLLSEKEKKRI